jgi:alkylation response protein AidB-like acyl-CoA dehydrogenase
MVTSTTTDDDLPMESFRERARTWLAENMQRQIDPPTFHDIEYYTPDVIGTNRALQRKLFAGGFAGISWPKEYGGQGLPSKYDAVFSREAAAYVMPDFGVLTSTTFHTCVPTMLMYASPDFLRYFVPQVLRGDALVCQFFSEPSAGSDMAGIRTRADRDGDAWRINGQKVWSTYAHLADWGMCLTRTDWDAPKHRGLTWFAVPCSTPGLTIRPIKQISESSEFCEDFFDDVVVPDSNRVGDVNQGWDVAQKLLVLERGAGRSDEDTQLPTLGPLAPDLLEIARQAGRVGDPVVRQKLARAHTNDFVYQALAWRIRQIGSHGSMNHGIAAYGKLFRGIHNPIRARIAVEIGGAGAMTWDGDDEQGPDISRRYLTARIPSIAGGTNEMQRNGIGERSLGLPREPSYDSNKPFSEVLRDASNWDRKI